MIILTILTDYLREVASIGHLTTKRSLLYAALCCSIAELRLSARHAIAIGRITQICRIGILNGGLIGTCDTCQIRKATCYAEQISKKNCGKRDNHNQNYKEGQNSHILGF